MALLFAGQAYKLRSGDRIQLGTEGTCVQVQFQEVGCERQQQQQLHKVHVSQRLLLDAACRLCACDWLIIETTSASHIYQAMSLA